ncbi:MAG TPA: type VI secretion system tip protein TssI/VgrG [Terriglobales bacterium]|nr:type VI secretion system tip protein TssI/VgrG [Terriglobales bacterium]
MGSTSNFTQENRLIAIETPLGDNVLLLQGFTGREGISRLFSFQLDLLSDNNAISFDDIVGQNVTIGITQADQSQRYFNGFVSRFAQSGSDARFTHYQMEVVPWLWFLTRNADCRIFQNMSIPDIIQKVFSDRGFSDFKSTLTGTYDPREYCVQYRETDFNFVSRLMEHVGIFYFFEHENGKHTLVLADSTSAYQPCPGQATAQYNQAGGGLDADDVVTGWNMEQELRTGKYSVTDYNFETPSTSLLSSEPTVIEVGGNTNFEIYDYPGDHLNQSDGSGVAKLRMQEEEAAHKVINGSSTCRAFTSGYKFDLEDHYRDDMNDSYVLTEIQHVASEGGSYNLTGGGGGESYSNHFICIPADLSYRPPRVTPKPFVQGPQTALVVGKAGEEIWVDKYGRVIVQFFWDRDGKKNENSSCWIRTSQSWAGGNWGSMWIPRIGQEVIVSFLEGDPDRPIITGRVYNAEQMPAYTLPDEQTKSYIKSYSSKGGGGFNEFRFEDKKGSEQVFINAEKNLDIRVKNNEYETVSKDLHLIVEQDHFEHIKNDHHETIDRDYAQSIGRDHHLKVSGKQAMEVDGSHSLKVTGDVAEQFGGNHSEQVSQALYLKAGMTVVIEAPMGITLVCGGNSVVVDPSGVTLTSSALVTIQGSMVNINSGPGSPAGSGSPCSLVPPMSPTDADEADKADPGEMAQIKAEQTQTQKGKYGSTPITPFKPGQVPAPGEQPKPHWIEIELVDEEGNPVPGEQYSITLPDGSVASGTLDGNGKARVDGIDPGSCKVTFANLDQSVWKPK